MNKKFRNAVESLEAKFQSLMVMEPIRARRAIPLVNHISGIYVFSDGNEHLYVGRSKRIRDRYSDHTRRSSGMNDAPFAVMLAREALNLKPSYRGENTRAMLKVNKPFQAAFQAAKDRILTLSFRYVEERDPLRQTLLECYVAIALNARYNSFETR